MVCDTPPYGHAPTYQISLTYLEKKCYGPDKKILFKKQLFDLEVTDPRSHEGHYGMWHTALWSCTHIPIIIDLSRKTKMLWPGQENTISKTIIWPWGQSSRSHEGHYSTWHTVLWSCIYELSVNEQFCWIYLNYLTLKSKVKVPRRSLWYETHCLMVMHPHTNYHWPTSKDKNVMARKTIIWPWCQRSRSHEGHYGTRHTALWSCTYKLSVNEQLCWIYLNYLTLRSKVKVPRRSLWYATHRLMVMHTHTNYHWPTSKDKNVMAQTRKYYLKNNYLTLRSKVKVPWRSLWYATQRLMVMHIRTICQWTALLDLFELFDLQVKGQGPMKVIMVCDTPPYGHAHTYQLSLTYLERQKCYCPDKKILFKKQLFDLEVKDQGPMKVIMVRNTPS